MIPDLHFVMEKDPEWERMWQSLGALKMNRSMPDPTVCFCNDTAEAWQYMGSYRLPRSRHWVHEFRHRHHPQTKDREYVRIRWNKKAAKKKGGK